jgi:type IV pilus assembly protein PilA
MVQKLRERSQGEGGFTLVELLVVMLILGLLAAIAIPSFFNQRDKARDADSKSAVRTAQTAMETYATDNRGSYAAPAAGTHVDALQAIETTLNDVADADMQIASTATSYSVQVESETGNYFRISRAANGQTSLTCGNGPAGGPIAGALTGAGDAGCPSDGNWG